MKAGLASPRGMPSPAGYRLNFADRSLMYTKNLVHFHHSRPEGFRRLPYDIVFPGTVSAKEKIQVAFNIQPDDLDKKLC